METNSSEDEDEEEEDDEEDEEEVRAGCYYCGHSPWEGYGNLENKRVFFRPGKMTFLCIKVL